jgi:threonine dehydrogenase-like Zn-dependent dehydrogenase
MISSCGQPGRGPGRVVLFGLYPDATLSPLARWGSGVTLAGDVAVLPSQFPRAIRWVEYGKVLAEPMVSRRCSGCVGDLARPFRPTDPSADAFRNRYRGAVRETPVTRERITPLFFTEGTSG